MIEVRCHTIGGSMTDAHMTIKGSWSGTEILIPTSHWANSWKNIEEIRRQHISPVGDGNITVMKKMCPLTFWRSVR